MSKERTKHSRCCDRKRQYASPVIAARALVELRKKFADERRPGDSGKLNYYLCLICGKWHLGKRT